MIDSKENFTLKGIVPPLVTPLTKNLDLDVEGLRILIDHVIEGGVNGVFILGTTGELSRLNRTIKDSLIKNTCRHVNGRVPVLVGITDTAMQESLRIEKIARESGADAAVLAPPFYYHVEQIELLEYFRKVAERIELPLFLYNMPSRTHINIEINTVVKAAEIPGIVGLKDSSGDFMYLQKLLLAMKNKKGFSIFVGPEEIMSPAVLFGASGGVNGGANLFPELYVRLYKATINKEFETVFTLHDVITHISSTLYQAGKGNPNFIKILKEAMRQKGICKEYMAEPYVPYTDEEKMDIASCLDKIKVPEYLKTKPIA